MNRKSVLLQATNLFVVLMLLVACSTPPAPQTPVPPTATASPTDETTINKIVEEAGRIPPPDEEKGDNLKIVDIKLSNDGKTRYITEKHKVKDYIDNILYLGLNDDIIWPANLVRGDKANEFVYEPITVKREPITLSISLESSTSTGSSITQKVEDPKLSTIRQGMSNLIKNAILEETKIPAKVDFSYQRVYDESQMNLVLGIDVKYGAGKLNTKFNWDSKTQKTKILAVYKQIYYSIDVDTPINPADFIDSSMTVPELRAAMPKGSIPMYVASVSYGMMALMFIETDASEEIIKAALEAEYSGGAEVKVNGELTAKNILESSSIKIIVYGGSTADLRNLETGYDGFKKVIEASSDFGPHSPGVPILYKFRHLADNTLALTTLTSEYTITRPVQIVQTVKVTLDSIKCIRANDDDGNPIDVDILEIGFNAYNRTLQKDDKKPEDQLIEIQPVADINYSTGKFTKFYFMEGGSPWRANAGDIKETGNINHYISFNTDPDIYEYEFAKIDFVGYAHDNDPPIFLGPDDSSAGKSTVYLRDFLNEGGEHTFLIYGVDFTLEVKVKFELMP